MSLYRITYFTDEAHYLEYYGTAPVPGGNPTKVILPYDYADALKQEANLEVPLPQLFSVGEILDIHPMPMPKPKSQPQEPPAPAPEEGEPDPLAKFKGEGN